MKVAVFPLPLDTARALIRRLIDMMDAKPDNDFYLAGSGGSTPALMFDLWCNEYNEVTPWNRLQLFWVDERCVRPEDPDSNYGLMNLLLLSKVPIPAENIHRIHGENDPKREAIRYSQLVKDRVPNKKGCPEFDVVILGAGEDGHTSSIFPGQEALLTTGQIYVPSIHPQNGLKRVALTGIPILNARLVIFLITGTSKVNVVKDICYSGDIGPAAYVAHHAERVELFLDAASAREIKRG